MACFSNGVIQMVMGKLSYRSVNLIIVTYLVSKVHCRNKGNYGDMKVNDRMINRIFKTKIVEEVTKLLLFISFNLLWTCFS